jgi:hypothetical protein
MNYFNLCYVQNLKSFYIKIILNVKCFLYENCPNFLKYNKKTKAHFPAWLCPGQTGYEGCYGDGLFFVTLRTRASCSL